ncbi:MAG: peroxiredoxin [Chloroherpetonaceae bacterium]|nr:peroxiredoxin [Chloroherpetonaceae bacterium]
MTLNFRYFTLVMMVIFAASCSEQAVILSENQEAPDFALKSDNGNTVTLSQFKGKSAVVLYFYPKDGTPGCTKEACSFRDKMDAFEATGIEVIGISTDDIESHEEFRKNEKLNFTLVSDESKEVSKRYGVLGSIGLAKRVTFLIDREGIIRKVFQEVKPESHAEEVMSAAKALGLAIE